jgi:hypothetical protein
MLHLTLLPFVIHQDAPSGKPARRQSAAFAVSGASGWGRISWLPIVGVVVGAELRTDGALAAGVCRTCTERQSGLDARYGKGRSHSVAVVPSIGRRALGTMVGRAAQLPPLSTQLLCAAHGGGNDHDAFTTAVSRGTAPTGDLRGITLVVCACDGWSARVRPERAGWAQLRYHGDACADPGGAFAGDRSSAWASARVRDGLDR